MRKIINVFGLVTMLLAFTSCGNSLTNSVYSFEGSSGKLYVIKFYEDGKVVFTDINGRYVDDESALYMCYSNSENTEVKNYHREGNAIKISEGGIIKDELKFENGVIKWKGADFKLDKRFSTIKKTGKYAGTIYVTNYGSEDAVIFIFIDDKKVMYIDRMKKSIRDYEIENGKLIIPDENFVFEEGKDKLIFNSSWATIVFQKHEYELDDFEFINGDFSSLKWK